MSIFKVFFFACTLFIYASCGGNSNAETQNQSDSQVEETGYPEIDKITGMIMADAKNPELYYNRAKAYAEIEAYDNAISDMFVSLKLDSTAVKYYYFLSDIYLNYYRSSEALGTLEKAYKMYPDNHSVALRYGELLLTLNQNPEAMRVLDKVLLQNDQNPEAFFLMGYLMKIEKDTLKAKVALRRAVELDPEIVDAYLFLAELTEKSDPALALQYLENAVQVSNRNPGALHNKAYFLQNHDDIQGAIQLYQEIIDTDPQYTAAFLNVGILYLELDSVSQAYENFNILTKIQPENYVAYFYRGLSAQYLNRFDEAKADYEQALAFKPDYDKALKALELLEAEND